MREFVLSAPAGRRRIDYEKELNAEQLDVVLHGDGACLVLAGAGSGKTRTITYRVAHLLDQGVRPEEILLLTFTNKAAREMLARVEALLGSSVAGLWGGTFHSVANRILRGYAADVGRTASFTILDQEDSRDLIGLCLKDLHVDTTARRFPSAGTIQAIVSYRRNAALPLRDVLERSYESFLDLAPVLERVDASYERRKREADAVDFDDLLLLLRDLLAQRPDVRDRLAGQFRYVLADEYQDTNAIQADLVRLLSSAHRNVLVVGDDAQSIYSFRAADIRNILRFPETYGEAKTFRLVTNYRSTPEILSVANAVIAQNRHQFKKELKAVRASADKPCVVPAANAQQEAQYVAEQMLALRGEGVALADQAVLFRAAFHSQALEFELMKRDIPYEYRGGMKFFERAHVKDIVAHLRLVANPKDEAAWLRVLALQPGVGAVTAARIAFRARAFAALAEAVQADLDLTGRAAKGWRQAAGVFEKLLAQSQPADMIRLVAAGAYRDYLKAEYPDADDRLDDLEQFALFAEGYDDLPSFLTEVSLTDEYGAARAGADDGEAEDRVVLSTVHQAKGLEWDAVFVINLAEGKFPHQRAMGSRDEIEEERRLFYVAVTRARKRLFLTYPLAAGHDTLALNRPSPFLLEIPADAVEHVRLRHAPHPIRDPRSTRRDDGEITIVFDELGERVPPSAKGGKPNGGGEFLRGVEEY